MLSVFKMFFVSIAAIFIVIGVVSCANKTMEEGQGETTMTAKTIEEVLKEHTDALMAIDGVVGVAQGLCNDEDCIKVYVIEMTPELEKKIPRQLDGYPVETEVTGEFKALPKS